tara:strand:+ start:3018 stop:3245 length:228 start_codon:yes stop_codon:yes gene_type:complete
MQPAEFVISELGGLTKTARAIRPDFAVTTVQGWRERGRIPQEYWEDLIAAAAVAGKQLAFEDFVVARSEPAEPAQ